MIKKSILILLLISSLFSQDENIYKNDCPVPDVLIKTIKLTENKTGHPYLIRTNDTKNLKKFKSIIKKYSHDYPDKNDNLVIDCKDENNCVKISLDLINSGITNLDLGIFQINYDSFPYNLYTYFDESLGYKNACKVVMSKIKITKKWDWETLAAYHSLTPHLNTKYKNKLIENYKILTGITSIENTIIKNTTDKNEKINEKIKGKVFISKSDKQKSKIGIKTFFNGSENKLARNDLQIENHQKGIEQ